MKGRQQNSRRSFRKILFLFLVLLLFVSCSAIVFSFVLITDPYDDGVVASSLAGRVLAAPQTPPLRRNNNNNNEPPPDRTSAKKSHHAPIGSTAIALLGKPAIPPAVKREAATQRRNAQTGAKGGAFVHIGKTGGSTLSVLLRDGCHSFMDHPCRNVPHESAASLRTTAYYHVPDFGRLSASHHAFYTVSVRDPYDRTISAFVFEHLRNRLARNETIDEWKIDKYEEGYRCFPTLQAFADNLGYNPRKFNYPYSRRSVHADSCPDLASAALYGRIKLYNHLYFSMDRIRSFLPKNNNQTTPLIFVTRQEHLWDDWKSVNNMLGQNMDTLHIPRHSQYRNTTVMEQELHLPVQRVLSVQGQMILCNALREEYQAYFWFLQHAHNLQPTDLEQSVQEAQQKCPIVDMEELLAKAAAPNY